MLVGVIGDDEMAIRRTLDAIATGLGGVEPDAFSLRRGVALASWRDRTSKVACVVSEDHAVVGTMHGTPRRPGDELAGDFAMLARAEDRLLLSRARFAGRPLYWMRVGRTTVASTRMLALALAARKDLRLEPDYLHALFDSHFYLWVNPMPFVGSRRVQPNTLVELDSNGGAQVHAGPLSFGPELRLSGIALATALRDEFRAAIARQSHGARRIAVLAGGGVDSSNLLALAIENQRRHGGPEVTPIAYDFGGPGDDRPHLATLCRHLNVEPVRVAPADGGPFGLTDRVIDAGVHAIVPCSYTFAALAAAKAAGAERVLGGADSELVLDTNPALFGDFLLRKPIDAMACLVRFQAIDQTHAQNWQRMVLGPLLRHVVPVPVVTARARMGWRRGAMVRDLQSPWIGPSLRSFWSRRPDYPRVAPIASQRERVEAQASSPMMVTLGDFFARWEISTGLPMARPYVDDEFLRFVARLPTAAMFAGARERGLLRESMAELVPDSVRYRMDKSRPWELLSGVFTSFRDSDEMRDLLTMRELDRLGVVNAPVYRTAFDRFARDPIGNEWGWYSLWGAIAGEAYARWFRGFTSDRPAHTAPFAVTLSS
jgi:hypothetical protein